MSKKKQLRKDHYLKEQKEGTVFLEHEPNEEDAEEYIEEEKKGTEEYHFDEADAEDYVEEEFENDDLEFVSMEEEEEESSKKQVNWKKVGKIAGIVFGILAVIYLGISVYFINHFYIDTKINGNIFSGKSADDVEAFIKDQVKDYTLTIKEQGNKYDQIVGKDISLEYKASDEIQEALKGQNPFLWPKAFFVESSTDVKVNVSYDQNALNRKIENLQAVKAEQIPPVSAYPKYNGTEFVVEPEKLGTAVDMEMLEKKVQDAISGFQPELDMEKEKCYAIPKYTSESKEVETACKEMNQYLKGSITYTMDENVVVDKDLISTWVVADENMQVTFNEAAVKEWLAAFGDKYDTMGGTRTITTPWGKTVEVTGGDYGWSIDEEAEFTALTTSIKNGEVVTKEPAYYQGGTAASHGPQDWGTTYAEVDLSAQHMWFIVDGAVAMESDVVTGVPIPAKETTPGVWFVKEMSRNATLVGAPLPGETEPEYRTPVAFWMRITWSGIGFHDATWQPSFGGSLYANGYGSHGCINMPYDAASQLFNMMPVGTPVVVHY